MADTTKANVYASLAKFYEQQAAQKRFEREQEERQKEYENAIAEQSDAQRERDNGGFFGGIGYVLEKIGLGFLSGIEGIWDYTAGGFAKLFGADDWAEEQIANDWVNYNHADEWFNPSEGWQFLGDVAGGIGTSLPAISGVAAGGAATVLSGGTLSPFAATLIAGSIAGTGAAGRATKEAYDQTGELTSKEFGYGAISGITEGAIEGVSAIVGAGTGAVVKNVAKSFGKEVAQSATRQTLIKGIVKGFAGEAFEEGVQAILEPYYKRLTYDPNAKNATFQEVAYAALVGGLSGAIMGGADVSFRNARRASRGNTIVQNGKSGDVITTAEQISNYQTENNTDYRSFQLVRNTLTELQNSLQKTDGQIQTVKQKMLLGILEKANTTAAFEPIVTSSAENIYNNADAIAVKLNELGYTDTNGKPIQVTAEQLRDGIDTTDAKTLRKTMSQALKTNSALRTLAVADAVGKLSMDTAKFKDATLSGQRLSTQADLNRFIEQATDAERQAVAEKLGIENWETLTNDVFQTKIAEFVANGGIESYQQEYALVKEANSVAPESAKKTLPRMVNLRNDGTYRYTQGNTDISVIKRGDTYYVYDYDSKRMSKPLSRTETNKVLREIHTNESNYTDGVRQHNAAQNRLKQQAAELDIYARENITDYKNASASGQAAIRAVIRQGKALGLQEDFVLSCARVSARSGLRIVFSKEASFMAANGSYADGAIDLTNNRIIINPEAKSRSGEMILIHELTHAIYNLSDGTLQVAEGLETMTDAEKENIRKRYSAVGQGSSVQVGDEINAHFAEQTLSNKNILERLVEKKPTLKNKILGFFKKAQKAYTGDEKLSGAAARLYRQYKKLFDSFSAQNQRYLGLENASEQARISVAGKHFALKPYSEKQKENWKGSKDIIIYESFEQLQEFVRQSRTDSQYSKKIYFGAIGSELAARIETQTGLNLENYNYALRADEVRKIFKDHGSITTEVLRGQRPVKESDFLAIPDILDGATSISLTDKQYNEQPAIIFSKVNGNEKTTIVAVVSGKHLDLRVQTEYIGIKKGTLATPLGEQAPNNTPKASRGTDSTNSIRENSENVNSRAAKSEAIEILFADSAQNQRHLGVESETVQANTDYALQEALETLGDYDAIRKRHIESNENDRISRNYDEIINFIKSSTRETPVRRLHIGTISERTAALVQKKTGINIKGYDFVLASNFISHIFDSHGNIATEALRGQRTVNYSNIENILETVISPDDVILASDQNGTALRFEKELDGKNIAITIMSTKKSTLTLKSAWIINKKSGGRTPSANASAFAGTSETNGRNSTFEQSTSQSPNAETLNRTSETLPRIKTVSNNSISENSENVNHREAKNGKTDGEKRYALPDIEKIAVKTFGRTYSWAETGYILTDGAKLDFSGRHEGARGGYRTVDHRDISQIEAYSDYSGNEAMIDFMNRGNIRIMPEGSGVNLSVLPTRAQEATLSDFITKNRGEITLDIDNERGETIVSVEYPRGTHSNKVLQDIRKYFENGAKPSVSDVQKFRYALPAIDSEGNTLSQEQREFFEGSKVVDDKGNLLVVYHGTKDPTFYEFKPSGDQSALGAGIYFSVSQEYAKGFSFGSKPYEVYLNITNPYIAKIAGGIEQNYLIAKGYDGIYNPSNNFWVAFYPEQIKLTTNKQPTNSSDIRFALDGNEDGNRSYGGYSVGQRAHFAANNTGMRVYTKAEATEVINSIIEERLVFDKMGMYGELRGKDRQQVIDYLYTKLNTVKEGYRTGVALKIADFLIENTVLTDMYANSDTSESMRILSVLRGYMHKLDLKGIQGEIRHKFDNKNSASLVWGAKEGGIAPDTLPQVLAEEGIFIESENEAGIFFEMLDRYQTARAEVYKATDKIKLSEFGDAKTIKELRQQIADDVLNAYEQKGGKSKFAKLVEKYTTQINTLRTQLREANARNKLINSIVDKAQKMRDLKLGTFLNSSQYKLDVFKRSIETLAKLKYRGNFNIGGTRKVMAELRTWYTKENPVLSDTYEQGIADMLDEIASGTKGYTKTELRTINNVMAYFINYVEKFNKVYRKGKWIDAVPEAERYIDTIHSNEQVKVGLFRKMTGSIYMQTFGDPMTVARRMDLYENGFYTETLTELREAKIDAEITEMEVKADYEVFLKKNKKYLAEATKQTVKYRGVDISRIQLIGLYMTLKRNHAQAGLVQNGFAFTDNNGKRVRVQGFNSDITEESDLRVAALDEQSAIVGLLTDADKEYIAILEKAYNQDAKKLKADRDMQRLGFTNATEEYYYPIRRGNIAKNVDTSDIQSELDRVSSSSFNKDTVRGAKQELYIESADAVFNRHIHAVTQYAALSPAIETYNRLYNLDISGNPNKPVSVATESANTWTKGNKYFAKLISDIQGIPSVSTEGMKMLSYIRGSYAKFQLGVNPKVWVTQLSSLFASSSILDAGSITKGMFVSAKGVDTYCPLAKLRNSDNTAAMAQGVLDKVGKVSNVLMAPIGKMDRFVVCRLFGASQVQIENNGGAKVGTEANKVAAGKLLKRVILETQQNTIATERSAAMRSGNEVLRTFTMFSADSMKVVGRVIDAIGEHATLKAKLRTATDTVRQEALKTQIKAARKKVAKSVTALVTSALFMVGIAQLFKWLYDNDRDEDETTARAVLVDFAGNLLGGLPLIRDIYSRLMEGYSIDNYAYSALNDLLDSAVRLMDGTGTIASRVRNLAYSVGQVSGIPMRNLYNVFYGLTKRFSPTSAYMIDDKFYKKNYVTDLNKAIENDDTDMIAMLMSMILNERVEGSTISDTMRDKLSDLYRKGYSVLPKSIGDTITYNNEEIPLGDAEYKRFKAIYSQSMKDLEKMIKNGLLDTLSEEKQAKAVKQLYDAYYYNALTDLVGVDERTTVGELSQFIDIGRLTVAFAGLSEITSDKNSKGETITGSQKKNTVDYLLKQNLTDGERLLILCYRGYTIQNEDYRGYSAKRTKSLLLKYILSLRVSQAQKAEIATRCGFTVTNGRIIKDF